MAFNSNITPGRPPLLWSDINDAFTKINENFDILVATVGDGSGIIPIDFSTLDTNVSPAVDNLYSLGESGLRRWKTLYLSEYGTSGANTLNGLFLGSAQIKGIGITVDLPANSTINGKLIIDPANSWFNSIQVDNAESIFAMEFNDSFGMNSGTGINLNVDSASESIIVTNTGIISASAGDGISVSGTNPLQITNTGVRTLQNVTPLPSGPGGPRIQGAGINISAASGDNIKITNTGLLGITQGFGILVSTDQTTGISDISFNPAVAPQSSFTRFHIVGDLSINDILSDTTADTFNIAPGYGLIISADANTDTLSISLNQRIDIIGSVFGDDSSKLVDGANGRLVGPVFTSTLRTSETKLALGAAAGATSQGILAVAVGLNAGNSSQGNSAVAVGNGSGQTSQGSGGVAIGNNAALTSQGTNAIAIGSQAGQTSQGNDAIAIGRLAGQTNQTAGSIVINAGGAALNTGGAGFYVDPVRSTTSSARPVVYNTTTKELFYTSTLEFINSTISTTDSSGLVVDVQTTFNADIIAENDIVVNNRLTSAILSTNILTATTVTATNASITNNIVVGGNTISKAVQSSVTPITGATGVVAHNYALGSTFRHISPVANFTVNITNMNLGDGYITQIRLIIVQDSSARVPTAVQIDGAAQSLLWKDNSPPTGNANKRDVVLFTISNISGSYIVLGELSTYG